MKPVSIVIIGPGGMGFSHLQDITNNERFDLIGIFDTNLEHAAEVANKFSTVHFDAAKALLDTPGLEAVVIATPYYSHTSYSIDAFSQGLHVLTEKPVGVHKNDIQRSLDAHRFAVAEAGKKSGPIFAAMFQQRTLGHWRKIKEIIDQGMLGTVIRATWIITNWFRIQYYYDNGGWRATWEGRGWRGVVESVPTQPRYVSVVS